VREAAKRTLDGEDRCEIVIAGERGPKGLQGICPHTLPRRAEIKSEAIKRDASTDEREARTARSVVRISQLGPHYAGGARSGAALGASRLLGHGSSERLAILRNCRLSARLRACSFS
jgi:hypothetical protein